MQDNLNSLIELLSKVPGLGPRSARRAVLHLLKKRDQKMLPLARLMTEVAESARQCLNCGNIGTTDICPICEDDRRATGTLCVVEDVADLWAMERADVFKGRYHVLGGTLSPLDDIGPEALRLPKLKDRILAENITEVILALNATVEGQTTAHYIAQDLEAMAVDVTSLAQGVPMGGELDYLDSGTIQQALASRKQF